MTNPLDNHTPATPAAPAGTLNSTAPPTTTEPTITLGEIFNLVGLVHKSMITHGVLDTNGALVNPVPVIGVASVAKDVEDALQAMGVHVQPNVDKIIDALPTVLALFGVK